jgi:hypothetical protein
MPPNTTTFFTNESLSGRGMGSVSQAITVHLNNTGLLNTSNKAAATISKRLLKGTGRNTSHLPVLRRLINHLKITAIAISRTAKLKGDSKKVISFERIKTIIYL